MTQTPHVTCSVFKPNQARFRPLWRDWPAAGVLLLVLGCAERQPLSGTETLMRGLETRVSASPAVGWLHYGGDLTATRYSALSDVHRGNVASLRKVAHKHARALPGWVRRWLAAKSPERAETGYSMDAS